MFWGINEIGRPMIKKSLISLVVLGLLVCSLFSFSLRAEDTDKAFYAISSLKFFLHTLTNQSYRDDNQENRIVFDKADVSHLWKTASSHTAVFHEIQKAQVCYDEALNHVDNRALYEDLCHRSHVILQRVWKKLNPYTLPKAPQGIQQRVRTIYFYPNFDLNNAYLKKNMRKEIRPYLLPKKHPVRKHLDRISSQSRIILDQKSFEDSGFITLFHQPVSLIRVAKHPKLRGHLVKVYLDTQGEKLHGKQGWLRLTNRCKGAQNVRDLIKKKKLVHFSVPGKWLYPPSTAHLPLNQPKTSVQPVILVVTDMKIVSLDESVEAWKNKITRHHLDELYCVLSHGFASAYLPFNVPYCKNGKFAFVDTEHPKRLVDYNLAKVYLSDEMRAYWDELVRTGGNPR
jgi:hypothetical protein